MATAYSRATPAHLWIVGILSLLWNCFGGYDYVMSEIDAQAYLTQMGYGPDVVAWMESFPAWAVALWAIGVWASVAGSILLLLRSRHAVTAFLLSLLGALGSFVYQFTSNKPPEMNSALDTAMPIVILIVIVAQWYYAKRQAVAGVLK
jgi:hypothetical protein